MSIVIINNKPEPLSHFKGLSTLCCNVEDITVRDKWGFKPLIQESPIYFCSPANSSLYMDGGIDLAYSRMFRGIQQSVQAQMNSYPQVPTSLLGRKYLPVGGALLNKITDEYYLIAAPTMLLPQNIKNTNNAYHAMKAILKVWPGNGVLVVPILGGGVGRMPPEEVYKQIKRAMAEYTGYINSLLYLPDNLVQIMSEQPKIYENSEFIKMDISEIRNTDINGNQIKKHDYGTIRCKRCNKEIENFALKFKLINGQRVPDMDGSDGHGVLCTCGWWN
jgi:O-acetyl-ADP-ribose deacetylase (regulator of RNase III)